MSQARPYNIAFFSPQRKRLLLLPCADPVTASRKVIADYNIGTVSFINVFHLGCFLFRLYVRSKRVCNTACTIYDLKADPFLKQKLEAPAPVLDWDAIKAAKARRNGISEDLPPISSFMLNKSAT